MDWEDIIALDQPLEGEALATVVKAAQGLGAQLQQKPELAADIRTLFAHRLDANIDDTTENELLRSLQVILGQDAAIFLVWSLRELDADAGLPEALASPEFGAVTDLVKTVYGLYGSEFRLASVRANQLADDWFNVNVQLFFDVGNAFHRLRLTIGKYNGDQLFLETSQRSLLGLATVFISFLKDADATEEIDAATAQNFLEASADLKRLLESTDDADVVEAEEPHSTH